MASLVYEREIGGGDSTSHCGTVDDVFKRFKSYLDEKVETISSGPVSQTETQKLTRVAEAESS